MKKGVIIWWFLILVFVPIKAQKEGFEDSLQFKGQISAWINFNTNNTLPMWSGGRLIPQLNYELRFKEDRMLDFEASINGYGMAGIEPFDSVSSDGDLKPYRLWGRYSTDQFEFRIGLQKINFGSATMLRPLMWFDQIDPRDPLQLTDGVYGALARYYFLNNANIWFWTLLGNDNRKGWEEIKSNKKIPEIGGRIQLPAPNGEVAATYHHRTADGRDMFDSIFAYSKIPENRIGLDAKFDMIIGCWFEASWIRKSKDMGMLTNQHIFNIGADYTFGVGNGLMVTFEQLLAAYDEKAFTFNETLTFSLLNLNYPIGLFDNISAIIYYDWTNNKAYNFLNWQKQFNRFSFYLMTYFNPKVYNIPTQEMAENLYGGTGMQLMVVFNF